MNVIEISAKDLTKIIMNELKISFIMNDNLRYQVQYPLFNFYGQSGHNLYLSRHDHSRFFQGWNDRRLVIYNKSIKYKLLDDFNLLHIEELFLEMKPKLEKLRNLK